MTRSQIGSIAVGCVLLSLSLEADTLVLRDGRRVPGTLIAIRDGLIEFEAERSGFFDGSNRVRVDRRDVLRIEFDDERDRPSSGVGNPGGGGRPSGLRERDVRVDARTPWTDTGVLVRQGQVVYFSASGRVRWGQGRQDGPEGERGSPRNDARPIPSRPAAALIGRVGDGNDYFFIGESPEGIRMRSGGRLYLGINDDFLNDNSGSFGVTVAY
jgi:hypothetical protein